MYIFIFKYGNIIYLYVRKFDIFAYPFLFDTFSINEIK